jgi:hypothetical protein
MLPEDIQVGEYQCVATGLRAANGYINISYECRNPNILDTVRIETAVDISDDELEILRRNIVNKLERYL